MQLNACADQNSLLADGLPDTLAEMDLDFLELSANAISTDNGGLPAVIYSLHGVRQLSVACCRIESVDSSIWRLQNLDSLELKMNPFLVQIPDPPADVRNTLPLRYLNLHQTAVREVPAWVLQEPVASQLDAFGMSGSFHTFAAAEFVAELVQNATSLMCTAEVRDDRDFLNSVNCQRPGCNLDSYVIGPNQFQDLYCGNRRPLHLDRQKVCSMLR